jgi:hypothetical protein
VLDLGALPSSTAQAYTSSLARASTPASSPIGWSSLRGPANVERIFALVTVSEDLAFGPAAALVPTRPHAKRHTSSATALLRPNWHAIKLRVAQMPSVVGRAGTPWRH